MRLPTDLRELILDYYWSHKMFECKRRLHYEMIRRNALQEMRLFYSIFNTITVELMYNNNHEELG